MGGGVLVLPARPAEMGEAALRERQVRDEAEARPGARCSLAKVVRCGTGAGLRVLGRVTDRAARKDRRPGARSPVGDDRHPIARQHRWRVAASAALRGRHPSPTRSGLSRGRSRHRRNHLPGATESDSDHARSWRQNTLSVLRITRTLLLAEAISLRSEQPLDQRMMGILLSGPSQQLSCLKMISLLRVESRELDQ